MRMVCPVARNGHGVSGRRAGQDRSASAHSGGRPGAGRFAGVRAKASRVRSWSRSPRPETAAILGRIATEGQMVPRTIAGFKQLPARNRDCSRQGRIGVLVPAAAAVAEAQNPLHRTEIAPALDFDLGSFSLLDRARGTGFGCGLLPVGSYYGR